MRPEHLQILPFVIAILIVWLMYRRFRRNFGRQPLLRRRMMVRMAILAVLAATLAPMALRGGAYLAAEALGAVLGLALALWGANRTRFASASGKLFYIPHTYTGITVSALLLGRIVYRAAELYAGASPAARAGSSEAVTGSPLTLGLFFVTIGYYVCYYARVLWRSKRLTAADMETLPAGAG